MDAGTLYGRGVDGGVIFHDLRRTCKTNMLAAGVDRNYRDLIIGHALAGMDRHYIDPTDEQLTAAMERYTAFIDAELEKARVVQTVNKFQVS